MAGTGSRGARAKSNHTGRTSRRPSPTDTRILWDEEQLRAELEREHEAAFHRSPYRKTVEQMSALVKWMERCRRHDGEVIHRSVPQIVRGIGKELGWKPRPTVKLDHQGYRNRIARQLDRLVTMGYVSSWEPVYGPQREGLGIRIRLTQKGRSSSAGQPSPIRRRRGGHEAAPPLSLGTKLSLPPGVPSTLQADKGVGDTGSAETAEGRAARGAHSDDVAGSLGACQGSGDGRRRTARVTAWRAAGDDGLGEGGALRRALAAGIDPHELLVGRDFVAQRELLVAWFEHVRGVPARYSPERWDGRLRLVLEQLDRYAGEPGAGAADLIDTIRLHQWAVERGMATGWGPQLPASLAWYVPIADRWRRSKRGDYRLARRLRIARRRAASYSAECAELFEGFITPELERREQGRWCRVRRALKQALDEARWRDSCHGPGPRELGAVREPRWTRLYGADTPQWRRDWRNW